MYTLLLIGFTITQLHITRYISIYITKHGLVILGRGEVALTHWRVWPSYAHLLPPYISKPYLIWNTLSQQLMTHACVPMRTHPPTHTRTHTPTPTPTRPHTPTHPHIRSVSVAHTPTHTHTHPYTHPHPHPLIHTHPPPPPPAHTPPHTPTHPHPHPHTRTPTPTYTHSIPVLISCRSDRYRSAVCIEGHHSLA